MAERSEGKSRRGFASMDEGRQREIASKGGRAAHAKGTAHEFDSSEARAAGRKGGEAVSRNREHMAAIGRKGGEARGNSARSAAGRGGNTDAFRPSERSEQGRSTASRVTDQDRTQQLRADEFPADQPRGNGRPDRDSAEGERGPRGRDIPGSDSRI